MDGVESRVLIPPLCKGAVLYLAHIVNTSGDETEAPLPRLRAMDQPAQRQGCIREWIQLWDPTRVQDRHTRSTCRLLHSTVETWWRYTPARSYGVSELCPRARSLRIIGWTPWSCWESGLRSGARSWRIGRGTPWSCWVDELCPRRAGSWALPGGTSEWHLTRPWLWKIWRDNMMRVMQMEWRSTTRAGRRARIQLSIIRWCFSPRSTWVGWGRWYMGMPSHIHRFDETTQTTIWLRRHVCVSKQQRTCLLSDVFQSQPEDIALWGTLDPAEAQAEDYNLNSTDFCKERATYVKANKIKEGHAQDSVSWWLTSNDEPVAVTRRGSILDGPWGVVRRWSGPIGDWHWCQPHGTS